MVRYSIETATATKVSGSRTSSGVMECFTLKMAITMKETS